MLGFFRYILGYFKKQRVLETFDGFVTRMDDDLGYVTLVSRKNSTTFYGEYPTEKLQALKIDENDSFICRVVEIGDLSRLDLVRVEPRQITDAEARAIAEKICQAFPDTTSEIEY